MHINTHIYTHTGQMSAAEHTHAHQHTLILTCIFRDATAITAAIRPVVTELQALSSVLLLHPHTRPHGILPSFAEEEAVSFVTHLMSVEI